MPTTHQPPLPENFSPIGWEVRLAASQLDPFTAFCKLAYGASVETHRTLLSRAGKARRWEDGWKRHLVVAGMQRAGTTLLYQIIRTCVDEIASWPRETPALSKLCIEAEKQTPDMVICNKNPDDVFSIPRIRNVLQAVRFVLIWRDPREVLASRPGGPFKEDWWSHPLNYLARYRAIKRHENDDDVMVIKYRHLLTTPEWVEARIGAWLGLRIVIPFRDFWQHPTEVIPTSGNFDFRPLDPSTQNKWRKTGVREHVEKQMEQYPELQEALEEYWE